MIENVEGIDRQRQIPPLLPFRLGEPDIVRPADVDRGEARRAQRVAADTGRTCVGHAGVKEVDAGDLTVREPGGEAGGYAKVAPAAGGKRAEDVEAMPDVEIGSSPFRADRRVLV